VVYDGLDIVGRAADQKGQFVTRQDIVNGGDGLLLKLGDGVDLSRVGYIEQVMWHLGLLLGRHFGGADIQAAIDLA
jgi:hypothetical protein